MPTPEGELTPAQLEILELVWAAGPEGLTITEVWETVRRSRRVRRTTVANLVDRLEKRSWLRRCGESRDYRYVATIERETAKRQLATAFVASFFDGSAADLVTTLVEARELGAADVDRLRRLLDEAAGGGKGAQP